MQRPGDVNRTLIDCFFFTSEMPLQFDVDVVAPEDCHELLGSEAACGETAKLPFSAGVGPNPTLPPPNETLIPTVHIAPAKGWPDGAKPTSAPGTAVNAFASGLDHPRWVYVLPNGDVLVAESNAPPKPEGGGIEAWIAAGHDVEH